MSGGYITDSFSVFRPLEQRARELLEQDKQTVFVPMRDLFELLRRLEYTEVIAAEQLVAASVAKQRDTEQESRVRDHISQLDALTGACDRLYYDHKTQRNERVSVSQTDFRRLMRAWGGPTVVADKDAFEAEFRA